MWLEEFVQTLLPNFHGGQIESDLKALKVELTDKTFPPYRNVVEQKVFVYDNPFQSKWAQVFNARIMGEVKLTKITKGTANAIERIYAVLGNMPEKIDFMIKMSNENTERTMSKTGLTYPQAAILRATELLEFMLVYARKVLLHIYSEEHHQLSDKSKLPEPFAPQEVKWLETHLGSFVIMLNAFGSDKENFIRALKSIPDLVIDDNKEVTEAVKANAGASLDPLEMGFIPYTWNPIYHIRVGIAEWRKTRLDAAIVERDLLEQRLLAYQAARNGENNAALEANIERMQNRLRKINIKINDLENSFNRTK